MSFLGMNEGGNTAYLRFLPSLNTWNLGKEEIAPKKMIFDLSSVKTGWGLMAEGQAPQWQWDDVVGKKGLKPDGDYKRGFSIRIYLGPSKGWAEWSSTGTGPCMGMDALMSEAIPLQKANPGKALACSYDGSEALKVGKGNTRKPLFSIIGWVDLPADEEEPAPAPTPAPKAKAKAAPIAIDDSDEF